MAHEYFAPVFRKRNLVLLVSVGFLLVHVVFWATVSLLDRRLLVLRARTELDLKISKRFLLRETGWHKISEDLLNISKLHDMHKAPFLLSSAQNENVGNYLFMIASMVGISRKSKMVPIVQRRRNEYANAIKGLDLILTLNDFPAEHSIEFEHFREKKSEIFSKDAFNIKRIFHGNSVRLLRYLQSWKYFHHMADEIRALLNFDRDLLMQASNILLRYTDCLKNLQLSYYETMQFVGIHVRRGDLLSETNRVRGYQVASDQYILRTIDLVQGYATKTIFVVVTNDLPYCKNLMKGSNFIFVHGHSRIMDMAILTLMDRIILTVGTFGWWSAYLSDAETVFYYKNPFRRNSKMSEVLHADDFYLPEWFGSA